jgi:hypothetical protein
MRPGTLRWAAPEHFSFDEGETKHTIKSDIYSFGNMALLVRTRQLSLAPCTNVTCQVLSGKYPWSEVRADAAVMLRLSQGLKPGRPLGRPIDNRHWALIERCWSSMSERPLAEDVVSSLQQLLGACPPPPPLRDFLDGPTPSSSVPDRPCNDDSKVTPKDSQQGIANRLGEDVRIDRPPLEDDRSEGTVSTPRKRVTNAPSGGPQCAY